MVAGGKSRGTGTKPPRSSQVPVSQVEPYPNRRLSGSAYVPVHVDVPRLPGSAYLPPGAACTPSLGAGRSEIRWKYGSQGSCGLVLICRNPKPISNPSDLNAAW